MAAFATMQGLEQQRRRHARLWRDLVFWSGVQWLVSLFFFFFFFFFFKSNDTELKKSDRKDYFQIHQICWIWWAVLQKKKRALSGERGLD